MIKFLFSYPKKRQWILWTGDVIFLCSAVFISYLMRVYLTRGTPDLSVTIAKLSPWASVVIIITIFTLYLLDQYNINRPINLMRNAATLFMSVFLSGGVTSGIFYFLPKYIVGRQVLIIYVFSASFLIITWRIISVIYFEKKIRRRRLSLIGNQKIILDFIDELLKISNTGFDVTSVCFTERDYKKENRVSDIRRYASVHDLILSNNFDALAFDTAKGVFSDNDIKHILSIKYMGKEVYDLSDLYQNLTGKVPISFIDGRWLLSKDRLQGKENLPYVKLKRIFDFSASLVCLAIFSPVLVLVACAIKLETKGPVLFKQKRLGKQKKPFICYKFRTMVDKAESQSGPIWSRNNDPRITKVGKYLRKSRLDELPQLLNIIKGDMSFIGPRPIREYFASKLSEMIPFYDLRFSIKPGLTGWAQVSHDYAGSEHGQLEKFQFELFYIQNMSLFLDLLITFKTFRKMLHGEGV